MTSLQSGAPKPALSSVENFAPFIGAELGGRGGWPIARETLPMRKYIPILGMFRVEHFWKHRPNFSLANGRAACLLFQQPPALAAQPFRPAGALRSRHMLTIAVVFCRCIWSSLYCRSQGCCSATEQASAALVACFLVGDGP